MKKAEIRRLYYRWVKDDSDKRSFQDIWEQRVREHIDYWQTEFNMQMKGFTPEVLGTVSLMVNRYETRLVFTSKNHMPLTIRRSTKSKKFIKRKIREYAAENIVMIDLDTLMTTGQADIMSTVWLG